MALSMPRNRDGPDGMIFLREHIAWLDFSVIYQEAADSHNNIRKGEIFKQNEYAPAEKVGIEGRGIHQCVCVIHFYLSSD